MRKIGPFTVAIALACFTMLSFAQSTGAVTQTVNARRTQGVLSASPSGTVLSGTPIALTYILHTAGAPVASEAVQFYDDGVAVGGPQALVPASGSNLLPYSQVNLANGWTETGTPAIISTLTTDGPDGSPNSATTVSFADSSSAVLFAVPGTSYAGQSMTLSIWAMSPSATTLSLTLTDSSYSTATSSSSCPVTATWQRCSLTYSFPLVAGTGFSAVLAASSYQSPISVWGAQVEAAAQPGPYVSTIGIARPSVSNGAGTAAYSYGTGLTSGLHTITVQYDGDQNLAPSTSNAVLLNVGGATPSLTLSASPSSAAVYGGPVILSALLTNPSVGSSLYPTGTITFYNNGGAVGTSTLREVGSASSSSCELLLTGVNALPAGNNILTATYGGDSNFAGTNDNSMPTTLPVAKAGPGSVTTTISSSLNPAVYGQSFTLTINVSSTIGAQPSGMVAVVDTATGSTIGTPTLSASGSASITIPMLGVPLFNAGSHSLTITYLGDSNYQ